MSKLSTLEDGRVKLATIYDGMDKEAFRNLIGKTIKGLDSAGMPAWSSLPSALKAKLRLMSPSQAQKTLKTFVQNLNIGNDLSSVGYKTSPSARIAPDSIAQGVIDKAKDLAARMKGIAPDLKKEYAAGLKQDGRILKSVGEKTRGAWDSKAGKGLRDMGADAWDRITDPVARARSKYQNAAMKSFRDADVKKYTDATNRLRGIDVSGVDEGFLEPEVLSPIARKRKYDALISGGLIGTGTGLLASNIFGNNSERAFLAGQSEGMRRHASVQAKLATNGKPSSGDLSATGIIQQLEPVANRIYEKDKNHAQEEFDSNTQSFRNIMSGVGVDINDGDKTLSVKRARLATKTAVMDPAQLTGLLLGALPASLDIMNSTSKAESAGIDSSIPTSEIVGSLLMGGPLTHLLSKLTPTPSDEDIANQDDHKWLNAVPFVGGVRLSRRLKKMKNDAKLATKVAGEEPGVPDGTGPHGRGMGPGSGQGDGSGMFASGDTLAELDRLRSILDDANDMKLEGGYKTLDEAINAMQDKILKLRKRGDPPMIDRSNRAPGLEAAIKYHGDQEPELASFYRGLLSKEGRRRSKLSTKVDETLEPISEVAGSGLKGEAKSEDKVDQLYGAEDENANPEEAEGYGTPAVKKPKLATQNINSTREGIEMRPRLSTKTSAAALDAASMDRINMLSTISPNPGIASSVVPGKLTSGTAGTPALAGGKPVAPPSTPKVKGASWVNHLEKISIANPSKVEKKPGHRPSRQTGANPYSTSPGAKGRDLRFGAANIDELSPEIIREAYPELADRFPKNLFHASQGSSSKTGSWVNHLEKIAKKKPYRGSSIKTLDRNSAPSPMNQLRTLSALSGAGNSIRGAFERSPESTTNPMDILRSFMAVTRARNGISGLGSRGSSEPSGTNSASVIGQAAGQGADFFNEVARKRDAIINGIGGEIRGAYDNVSGDVNDLGNKVDNGLGVVGDFASDTYNGAGDAISELKSLFG